MSCTKTLWHFQCLFTSAVQENPPSSHHWRRGQPGPELRCSAVCCQQKLNSSPFLQTQTATDREVEAPNGAQSFFRLEPLRSVISVMLLVATTTTTTEDKCGKSFAAAETSATTAPFILFYFFPFLGESKWISHFRQPCRGLPGTTVEDLWSRFFCVLKRRIKPICSSPWLHASISPGISLSLGSFGLPLHKPHGFHPEPHSV